MPKKLITILFASLLVLSLVLSACAPPPAPVEEPAVEVPAVEESIAEVEEEEQVSGITIQFWHVYGADDPRGVHINALVDEFNATNEYGITVESLDQGRYDDLEDKVNAGIQSGDLPNIAQAYSSALINWHTVDAMVDLNQFVSDTEYGLTEDELADIYPAVLEVGVTPAGLRIAWPLSQSVNSNVYNYTWAQELGFDSPPTTPEEFKEQICAAAEANATDDDPETDSGKGYVYAPKASTFFSYMSAFGGDVINEDGTGYDFNTPETKAIIMYINDLRDNGCAYTIESYANPEQANRLALVTTSSTSGHKYYVGAFDEAGNEDEWGFLPFLGPDGGVGSVTWIQTLGVMKSNPEQELASWLFIKFLTSAENQATWIRASGYLPTHFSTAEMVVDYVDTVPQYQAALGIAALDLAAEPEAFPAWNSVRRAFEDTLAMLYTAVDEAEVEAMLVELNITAAELVAEIE